ncbi:MAG: PAS domain S-box protein [Deltaproteobacteria bacterium]|nr:PAS domain S-box protein [Deltaproteobacteria bacterium]
MDKELRILLVEDLLADAELAVREIKGVLPSCLFRRVETKEDYLAALKDFHPDLIVSDYKTPGFDGLTALKISLELMPFTPFIVLTEPVNEETAVNCMKAGATDYIVKENIKSLGPRIISALQKKHEELQRRREEEQLKRIEWLLRKTMSPDKISGESSQAYLLAQPDLTPINDCRVILDAVGAELLFKIVGDYFELLDTSTAVYEISGDYALRLLSSGWCRYMSQASRRLCHTPDNREALRSGRWLCHESCWWDASKTAIDVDHPVDIECRGGVHLYAVPIQARNKTIGAICLGYGDPPRESRRLRELADKYQVNYEELSKLAGIYQTRPGYIIDIAKKRLHFTALMISEIVERKLMEEELKSNADFLQTIINTMPTPVYYKNTQGIYQGCNIAFEEFYGVPKDKIIGKSVSDLASPELIKKVYETDEKLFQNSGVQRYEFTIPYPDRSIHDLVFNKAIFYNKDGSPGGIVGVIQDLTNLRMIESSLHKSEEKHRLLFETMLQGIVYRDSTGRITDANPAAEKILGLSLDQLLERSSRGPKWKTIHEDGSDFPLETHPGMVALRTGTQVKDAIMGVFNPVENQIRWIMIDAVPLFKTGEITPNGVYTTLNDITEYKRAQEQLKSNEARLMSLIKILQYKADTIQDLLDYALDEAITLTGSKIGYIYDYNEDRSEFVLNTWSKDVMKECTITEPQTVYQLEKTGIWGEAVRQRQPVLLNDFQAEHFLKKGYPGGHANIYRYLTIPVFKEQAIVAVIGVANKESDYDQTDVLQLRLLMDSVWAVIDRKLAESHSRRLASVVDQAGESVIITDPEGKIQYVNSIFEKISGYSSLEVIGQNPAILKSGKHDRKFYVNLWETIKNEGIWTGRLINKKKDGALYHEQASIFPIRDENGRIVNYAAVKIDITNEVQLEAQFLQAQKMEAIGRLAGGVAHDFNNMLTIILGHSELMKMTMDSTSPLWEDVTGILNAAVKSSELVRQLLTFARKQIIAPIIMNINETLGKSRNMLARLIGEDIDIQLKMDPDLWPVKLDPSQFDQIITNFSVNSRDAIKGVGSIVIQTKNFIMDDFFYHVHQWGLPGEYVLIFFYRYRGWNSA